MAVLLWGKSAYRNWSFFLHILTNFKGYIDIDLATQLLGIYSEKYCVCKKKWNYFSWENGNNLKFNWKPTKSIYGRSVNAMYLMQWTDICVDMGKSPQRKGGNWRWTVWPCCFLLLFKLIGFVYAGKKRLES